MKSSTPNTASREWMRFPDGALESPPFSELRRLTRIKPNSLNKTTNVSADLQVNSVKRKLDDANNLFLHPMPRFPIKGERTDQMGSPDAKQP